MANFLLCFPTSRHRPKPPRKPPSHSPFLRISPIKLKPSWSFIKRIFSSKSEPITRSVSTTRPGSLDYFPLSNASHQDKKLRSGSLEQHLSIKHAVCELSDDDPGKNVIRILFGSGWCSKPDPRINPGTPTISRVMKINNSPMILTRFEEYRESVKTKAARDGGPRRREERCIADGNELLRFHCTTFVCDLGQNGNFGICAGQYCNLCGIIGSGFSPKLDGVSSYSSSWRAHVAVPEDIEDEFGFMNVKRAMIVCRVIAGRVGCDPGLGGKDDPGYDSLVGREPGAVEGRLEDEDELIVFDPRAVLPCFVIVYTV